MGRPKCFDRNEVLDKSIQLFWKKGFADTSLQELEKATGVNKSGLYSEFKDKEDLFVHGVKRYIAKSGALEALAQHPLGRKNIEAFLLAGNTCSGTKGCFLANTLREISILPNVVSREIFSHLDQVKKILVQNIAALNLGDNAELTAELILTYNSGLALRQNMGEIKGVNNQINEFLDKILK